MKLTMFGRTYRIINVTVIEYENNYIVTYHDDERGMKHATLSNHEFCERVSMVRNEDFNAFATK